MTRTKKIILTVGVVLAAIAALGNGTFASYNAQTTNPSNVFATGAIVMSNTKQGGTACLSTAGGATDTNANGACDQLLNLTVRKPGDNATVNLTIRNAGSIAATVLKVFGSACTDSDAAAETYHGTGSLCSQVQLYIQQYSDSGFTTVQTCLYGGTTVANTCDFSNAAKTLGDFASTYTSSSTGLTIGSGLTAGTSNYFKIGVQLPTSADNTVQGRSASISFNWFMQQ